MNALEMNWTPIKHFSPQEWPEGVLASMEADLIVTIDEIRRALPQDHALVPSPKRAAHIRTDGSPTSRHYVVDRLSDATDLFATWKTVYKIWMEVQRHPKVGGIGLYVDTWLGDSTVTRPMLHIDLRPERLLWVKSNEYVYLDRDPELFLSVLLDKGRVRARA